MYEINAGESDLRAKWIVFKFFSKSIQFNCSCYNLLENKINADQSNFF